MSDDMSLTKLAHQKIDEMDIDGALDIAEKLKDPNLRASVLIDAGTIAGKGGVIREGIALLEDLYELAETNETPKATRSAICYKIANGYSSIFGNRRRRRKKVVPPNDDDLRKAKLWYRRALEFIEHAEPAFQSQLWTNYGNCLSALGRGIESIQCYQKAIEAEHTNGMAWSQFGTELNYLANISGRYYHEYIALAQQALETALTPPVHLSYGPPGMEERIRQDHIRLQTIIDAHEEGIPAPVTISIEEGLISEYLEYCREHGLFLNAWTGDPGLEPALTDEIAFGPITTDLGDDTTVPELIRMLNEIKESFATARYLYYLSVSKTAELDEISKTTSYFRALPWVDDVNGIYIGLCKTAYTRAFDVLDKVAGICHIYFGLGKRRDTFWDLFAEKQSQGVEKSIRFVARPYIVKEDNYSLFALADLSIDYFASEHVDLETIDHRRNRITHDYLAVQEHTVGKSEDKVEKTELFNQTLSVLLLAKRAILYAVNAIYISEARKSGTARTRPMIYEHQEGDID